MKNNKTLLFTCAILITLLFVFFSIPSFMDSNKVKELLTRINLYQQDDTHNNENNENSDGSINIDKNDQTNNNDNDANHNDQSNSNNNQKPSTDNGDPSIDNSNNNNSEGILPKIKRTAIFNENGSISISEKEKSCEAVTETCRITLPIIVSNKDVMGWSEDKNAIKETYKPGETIEISENKNFYAITSKTLVARIYGNGAFAGSKKINCTIYNTASMCAITLPNLEKDFYTSWGYNRNPVNDNIEYLENQTITLIQNIELYAIRKINTSGFDNYRSVAQSIFQKLNSLRQSKGLNTLTWSKSLELSAMLRVEELKRNYDFNVNGDYHYRISNSKPFNTVNELAKRENYYSVYKILDAEEIHQTFFESSGHYNNMVAPNNSVGGIAIGFDGEWYYIVELFG